MAFTKLIEFLLDRRPVQAVMIVGADGTSADVSSSGILQTGGGGGGGTAVTVADGSDVALGATTGVALSADGTGTVQQYLRTMTKSVLDVWDSTNHFWAVNLKTALSSTIDSITAIGAAASGSPVSGNPVRVGLSDGTNTRDALGDTNGRTVVTPKASTGTPSRPTALTNVSSTPLALNAARLGATIWNEGTAIAYLKFGTTASTTDYTVQIPSGSYYEVPYGYTGRIDGITSSSTAQLQITELSN